MTLLTIQLLHEIGHCEMFRMGYSFTTAFVFFLFVIFFFIDSKVALWAQSYEPALVKTIFLWKIQIILEFRQNIYLLICQAFFGLQCHLLWRTMISSLPPKIPSYQIGRLDRTRPVVFLQASLILFEVCNLSLQEISNLCRSKMEQSHQVRDACK